MKTNENILAVDTSSQVLSVAILRASDAIFEANLAGTPRHSERMLGLIQEGLAAVHLKKADIHQLVWGLGPGSFTGLRIGLAALKGFSIGLKRRAFGVSSLDLIALGTSIVSGKLAVCVDARRQRIYGAIYHFTDGKMVKTVQDSLYSFDELMAQLDDGTIVTGDALAKYGEQIRSVKGETVLFLDSAFWYPRAIGFSRICRNYPNLLTRLTLQTMEPRYFRSSEAEENLKHRKR